MVPQPRTTGPLQCAKVTATRAPFVVVQEPTPPTTVVVAGAAGAATVTVRVVDEAR